MEIGKYKKKPVVIEAIKFENAIPYSRRWYECEAFIGDSFVGDIYNGEPAFNINTLEGVMRVSDGDYIVKGVEGEYYAVKPEIFHKTYEEVNAEEDKSMYILEFFSDFGYDIELMGLFTSRELAEEERDTLSANSDYHKYGSFFIEEIEVDA